MTLPEVSRRWVYRHCCGSPCWVALKVAGKGTGLDGLRQMLSARFNRGRRETVVVEATPA